MASIPRDIIEGITKLVTSLRDDSRPFWYKRTIIFLNSADMWSSTLCERGWLKNRRLGDGVATRRRQDYGSGQTI
jgi:hypothetical protein